MPEEMRGGPPTDIYVQLVISLIVGFSSFIGFCFLRTRWSVLYAARQKSLIGRVDLPKLPDSFFGWIPVVYHITEDQILEAAGLDAFVFLAFFKQASRFLLCAFILGLTILTPVHNAFPEAEPIASNNTNGSTSTRSPMNLWGIDTAGLDSASSLDEEKKPKLGIMTNDSYLWMYPIFVYLFSLLALYFLVQETRKIIHVRQRYLGGQSTVTDRTIRLTGIPEDFRTEEKIKDFIEELQIGKVDRVTLCRDWSELDGLVDERMRLLRKLEEAWTVHLGTAQVEENGNEREVAHLDRTDEEDEEAGLLANGSSGRAHIQPYARTRPTVKLRYGFFGMQTRSVDSIDYYEEKVKNIDEQIRDARKKEYKPVSLAFVTLDSVAACQMAIQAKLDPSPLTLLAAPAPAPPDVIWPNTYQSRRERLVRGWTITTFIALLTIFFTTVSVPLAGLINLEAIKRATPQFGHFLDTHYITRNLVQSTLPTVILSLLNVAVPYIYDWLSTYQGFIAGGDTEISSIAKNYIFVYFNSFLVFTIVGSGVEIYQDIKNALLDTSIIFYRFANSLSILAKTYTNFILLQGVALAPFRALEIGAVFCYPIGLVGARTPRDFAELARPPLYKYSLTIPQAILIYNLAIIYSVLRSGTTVLFFALIYFLLGHFFLKYQLLYAMESPAHSTGKAWPMIASRVTFSIVVFQIAMAGVLATKRAINRAVLIVPLIAFTIFFMFWFRRSYSPLMRYIALRAIERDENGEIRADGAGRGASALRDHHQDDETLAEHSDHGLAYANPSLVAPLPRLWISGRGDDLSSAAADDADSASRSSASGSENVWARSG